MKIQWLWMEIEDNYIKILMIWLFVYTVWTCLLKRRKGTENCFRGFLAASGLMYLFLFFYVTLFCREFGQEMRYELSFLWEYRRAFGISEGRLVVESPVWARQIRDNILLFVPMGILYAEKFGLRAGKHRRESRHLRWYKALASGFFMSLAIELSQLFFGLGLFEFDDMFNNSIGMMLGYLFFRCVNSGKRDR